MKTGGSRERLNAMRPLWAGRKRIEATGEYIARRRFREPPVLIFLGETSDEANVARAAGEVPKRLPSRRWTIVHHMNAPQLFEDEDDEDENDQLRD